MKALEEIFSNFQKIGNQPFLDIRVHRESRKNNYGVITIGRPESLPVSEKWYNWAEDFWCNTENDYLSFLQ